MKNYRTGCLICGEELRYFTPSEKLKCERCGEYFETDAVCQNDHFVCNSCHSKTGFECLTKHALETTDKNPISIATKMMNYPQINMHGPEHHYLIVAALLAAYRNSGGKIDLEKCLKNAEQRAKNVPGGICGAWGCCGAGIGAGMFISIIQNVTPLSKKEWGDANEMTSRSLNTISKHGGPRCCKRNTYLSIFEVITFIETKMNVKMERTDALTCSYFNNNPTCKKEKCLFYPDI